MDLVTCPNCGAPLPAGAPGTVESCRFCGVEGRARAAAGQGQKVTPDSAPYRPSEKTIEELCDRYIASVGAYSRKETVREEDERLMRAVEDKMDILEGRRDSFRGVLMELVSALAAQGKPFDQRSNERLRGALEKVLQDGRNAT